MSNPLEDAKTALDESRYADAAALLEPLTNAGNAEADYLYGCLLFSEPGLISRDDALDALQRAADLDHPAACYRVATTAIDGDGIQTDQVVDPDLLVHAAELGDVEAQRLLGVLHLEGAEGFPEDEEETRYWYERAAEQGDSLSQYDLGRMMLEGQGGKVDLEGGIKWLQACAGQNEEISERAADFLASLYEGADERFELEPSPIEAARWRTRQQELEEAAERARVEREELLAEVAAAAEAAPPAEEEEDEDDADDDDDEDEAEEGDRDSEEDDDGDDDAGDDGEGDDEERRRG